MEAWEEEASPKIREGPVWQIGDKPIQSHITDANIAFGWTAEGQPYKREGLSLSEWPSDEVTQ